MTMMAQVQAFAASPWGLYVISWFLAGFMMWLGAHLAGLRYSGVGRAFAAAVAATLVTWALSDYLWQILGMLGFVVAVSVTLLVIKAVFETSWERAFLVWTFNALGQLGIITMGFNAGLLQKSALHPLH
jgi:hypothetical protein